MRQFLVAGIALLAFSGCQSVQQHRTAVETEEAFTLGNAQRKIRKGMSQAEVVEALGSPNMVTKDRGDSETWVYDKLATEASYSQDEGGVWFLIGGYSKSSGATSTSQKTLTFIIKFDEEGAVKDVSYHASRY